jgi:propanol-preferring alcohol dehydrogenase
MLTSMRAMLFHGPGSGLQLAELSPPQAGPGQVRVRVEACGICRTDLHVLDGDLKEPALPLIPGHQIVGVVDQVGDEVAGIRRGERIGIPWLGGACGHCRFCRAERENLCDTPSFTGYQINGGFAEYAVADARFVFPIPEAYTPVHAAPLLCAGLIGYRCLRMAGEDSRRLGLYGFGAAAHIIAQVARFEEREIYAFTSPGDAATQAFARSLGANWAGGSDEQPPQQLDAAIIFAPVGALVPAALRAVRKGGIVVCGGIHMSDIPAFPYADLWGERRLCSVANLTRRDGEEFFAIAPRVPVTTHVTTYALEQTAQALEDLREGRFDGAAVIVP